jgi:hypothetical protein
MRFGTVVLGVAGALVLLRWLRAQVRTQRDAQLPHGVSAPAAEMRPLSTDHYDLAVAALRAFATEYTRASRRGQCDDAALKALHALRKDALGHMYWLRMRLPNDLVVETEFSRYIGETDALLLNYIEDAAQRCGVRLLRPGPLGDEFYKGWFRAHNDGVS